MPVFRELQPDIEQTFQQNIQYFNESYQLLQNFIEPIRQRLFGENVGLIVLNKADLNPYIGDLPLLFELFAPYGFSKNILADFIQAFDQDSGRIFQSDTHELLLDRVTVLLRRRAQDLGPQAVEIHAHSSGIQWGDYSFAMFQTLDTTLRPQVNSAQVDADLLIFPLTIRAWQEGDTFIPIGMTGKKKLSDFFIQQKINVFQKKQIPIILNGNGDIVWIANRRLDNRYKITANTKKVFTLVCT